METRSSLMKAFGFEMKFCGKCFDTLWVNNLIHTLKAITQFITNTPPTANGAHIKWTLPAKIIQMFFTKSFVITEKSFTITKYDQSL